MSESTFAGERSGASFANQPLSLAECHAPPESATCGGCGSLFVMSGEDPEGTCGDRRAARVAVTQLGLFGPQRQWPKRSAGDPACPYYRPHGGRHD